MKIKAIATLLCAVVALPAAADEPPRVDTTGWFENPAKLDQVEGEDIYNAICAACHMPDGKGAVGAGMYPALAGNENLLGADYPIHVILNGLRAMPALDGQLDHDQVAAVVNYIRTGFGNDWSENPATAETVAASH
ncbi:cytochrome c [Rhodovulum sulfidophilum]|uniref:c-type cytochrome n=1 Tax=Rhodovulum sulfidophilum TaxID=35806 RepID=UPI001920C02F|nr:cytochrome c [Rhodovulum sulfidophilum]MBL3564338.1 cytochrome c [Rhodovulum sulfidophilum]